MEDEPGKPVLQSQDVKSTEVQNDFVDTSAVITQVWDGDGGDNKLARMVG